MKAKFKSNLILSALIGCISIIITSIVLTFAWFAQRYDILNSSDNISGSVLKSYFHTGTGTDKDPFVITRPKHYENLVMLYYNMEGFSNGRVTIEDDYGKYERGFYFQIGYELEGIENDFKVFNYDDDGRPISKDKGEPYSTTLNLACYKGKNALKPLGSIEKPFISSIDGKGITLANFEINGEGFCDIGVFGYVGEGGEAKNLYFNNYTIDTTGATSKVENPSENHVEHQYKVNCNTGYIAGHISNSKFFTNVYANNCNIIGATEDYPLLNNYSYYGMVDKDVESSDAGSGKNYSFSLDSSSIYNYFNSYYNKGILMDGEGQLTGGLKDTTMRVRNTEYDSTLNNNDVYPPKKTTDDSTGVSNFTESISYEEDNHVYRLTGNYTDRNGKHEPNPNRNYSLSTLGYYGPKVDKTETTYEVYYDDNGTRKEIPTDTTVSGKGKDELATSGNFFYYGKNPNEPNDEDRWTYIDSKNKSDGTTCTLELTFKEFNGRYSRRWIGKDFYPTSENTTSVFALYLDNQMIPLKKADKLKTENKDFEYTLTFGNKGEVIVNIEPLKLENIYVGTHYISFKGLLSWTYGYTSILEAHSLFYYGTIDNSTINQIPFEIDAKKISNGSYPKTIEFTSNGTNDNNEKYEYSQNPFVPIAVISDETKVYNIIGKNFADLEEKYKNLTSSTTKFYYEYEKWYADEIVRKIDLDPNKSGPVYIGDDPDITSSGYNSKNIDIVGGGITFGTNYINMTSESQALTKTPSVGEQFYSTYYCANSIVLYLKNVGDDNMGSISVNYSTIGALFNISLKAPAFKKGGRTFVQFSSLDNGNSNHYIHNDSGLDRSIEINGITPTEVKKASFCGIDENGQIVAIFDSNGNVTDYIDKSNGKEFSDSSIKYYVLCLGLENDSGIFGRLFSNTRITRIDFSYKAEEGYGGKFGSVGYRSSPDEITNTILNFYYIIPSGNYKYSILVSFSIETKTYNVTIKANKVITVTIFLYDRNYGLVVNGVDQGVTPGNEYFSTQYSTSGDSNAKDYYP